jgi:hypothetical protein
MRMRSYCCSDSCLSLPGLGLGGECYTHQYQWLAATGSTNHNLELWCCGLWMVKSGSGSTAPCKFGWDESNLSQGHDLLLRSALAYRPAAAPNSERIWGRRDGATNNEFDQAERRCIVLVNLVARVLGGVVVLLGNPGKSGRGVSSVQLTIHCGDCTYLQLQSTPHPTHPNPTLLPSSLCEL